MNEQEAKLAEELRRQCGDETIEDGELLAILQEIEEYEASTRPAGMHWPEDFAASILGLEWVELKESVDGKSVEEALSDLLDTLTPRENKVIQLFYKEEKGLIEIGKEFNVSYAEVRSVLAKGLRKLLHPSRAKRLAACIEKSDKEPFIRTRERTLNRWLDDIDAPDAPDADGADDDIFKDIFDEDE